MRFQVSTYRHNSSLGVTQLRDYLSCFWNHKQSPERKDHSVRHIHQIDHASQAII